MREAEGLDDPLFMLTNRLSPMKVAMRVLVNLHLHSGPPSIAEFRVAAGSAARLVGLLLRAEDEAFERRDAAKRSVAYPHSADRTAALDGYADRFTVGIAGGKPVGPLLVLGLVAVEDHKVFPTPAGWRIAKLPSPVLERVRGPLLTSDEAKFFRAQLHAALKERAAISFFVDAVRRAEGAQSIVDAFLSHRHADWDISRTTSQRSAMLGRLTEARIVEAEGRGPQTLIRLLAAAEQFSDRPL